MGKRALTAAVFTVAFLALTVGASLFVSAGSEESLPSKSDASCLKCHNYDKQSNILAGKFVDLSRKAKTIQLQIGPEMEVIHFDDATVLKNAPAMKDIPKQESVRVTYAKKDGKTYAREVEVKKGLEVPGDKLASVEEVAKLVAMGPEKGRYVLLDSRPGPAYDEGHIPTAKKMPFFAFDDLQEKILPADKEMLQIYYCSGFS
jgi:hypothetical protein